MSRLFPEMVRLELLRDRLRSALRGPGPGGAPERGAGLLGVTRGASARGNATPIEVVVTPQEMNDLHGTGFLVKRAFAGRRDIVSLRIRDEYGGVHDFGDEAHLVRLDGVRRPEVYAAALEALRGRPVKAVHSIPYTSEDLLLAMAVRDVTGAPLCLWEMDDQCIAHPKIPKSLMREFLGKCRLRLATHTELRDAYEQTFGFPFGVLPAVVPAALVRPEPLPRSGAATQGALLGSVWSRTWLDDLAAVLDKAHERLTWYGNHRSPGLRLAEAQLADMPFDPLGVVKEPKLAEALLEHPFAVVPTSELKGDVAESEAIAALSLPGRILFAVAAAHTPIIVVGSERTPAAALVRRHGLGEVVPYVAADFKAAADRLRRPEVQAEVRERARRLAPSLTDAGVGDWLDRSIAAGAPHDDRFERLFPREAGQAATP
jgi:hypothetical protein